MRILFDQGVPLPLREFLTGHEITTAHAMGWAALKNGDLLNHAENEFDLIITTDKNWKYQQRVTGRRISIAILPTTNWPELRPHGNEIAQAVTGLKPGDFLEL